MIPGLDAIFSFMGSIIAAKAAKKHDVAVGQQLKTQQKIQEEQIQAAQTAQEQKSALIGSGLILGASALVGGLFLWSALKKKK